MRGGVAGASTCPLAARWRVTPARGMGTTRAWSRASREQAGAARGTRRRQWVPRASPGRAHHATLPPSVFFLNRVR